MALPVFRPRVSKETLESGRTQTSVDEVHLAFRGSDHDAVHAFHTAAMANGGVDNGAAGPRPDYGAEYYAAFVRDPDGHNVEAVVGGVRGA